jgi:hypothetical protein
VAKTLLACCFFDLAFGLQYNCGMSSSSILRVVLKPGLSSAIGLLLVLTLHGSSAQAQEGPNNPNERILNQQELEAGIKPHVAAIQACYVNHASKQRGATGELQLELLIRPEGKVQRLWVRAFGVSKKEKLTSCLEDLSKTWQFAKKPGFTNAVVPFLFQKTKAKGAGPFRSCWSAKGCPEKKKNKKEDKTK